jgi:hypothetical protein
MLTAAGADSQEERPQRTRRSRCRPSRLDEHAARMWTSEPHRFKISPLQQMPGLNT